MKDLVERKTGLDLQGGPKHPVCCLIYRKPNRRMICTINSSLFTTLSSQLISQEPNKGVEYEYYLPNGRSREGYYWSFGSWSTCSRECGSGQSLGKTFLNMPTCRPTDLFRFFYLNYFLENITSRSIPSLGYQSRLVFCTIDNEAYPDYLCASMSRPQTNRTCNPHPCPQVRR